MYVPTNLSKLSLMKLQPIKLQPMEPLAGARRVVVVLLS